MKGVALIALTCLALTACGGDDNSSPAASGGSGTSNNGGSGGNGPSGGTPATGTPDGNSGNSGSPTASNVECDPVYQQGDTVQLRMYTQATSQSPAVDNGVYTRTYAPATFGGVALTQQAETTTGSPIQTNHYYLVGNGVRTNYGGEVYSGSTLALRDVNSPPYVETIGLAGSETVNYVDTPVFPSGGVQTSVSIERAYVARETVSLRNGKVFANACHYHTTETFTNSALTSKTIADDWLAPGVGLVKSIADVGGSQIITRELESATVGGKSY
ncbi:TPA: hypothetical protein SAY52_005787 [Burkholderia cenocepacia]|uniref:hypothetical protein n=1 Tax=unclassified Burkholderia TaxID=2613784 RepID=UPI0015899F63|nr:MULTISPECIES: hypothetical protein [unclassified Burkholderia]HEF5875095.1 hypothetical protein [Burkholderia cenocepacia]